MVLGGLVGLLSAPVADAWTTLPARTNDVPGFVYRQSASDWRDITIYQVMTDRFFNGDTGNDDDNPRGTVDYAHFDYLHGGDFEGVQQKLDYIQLLGAKAILISPVLHNTWGAYQGYGVGDFNQIDPHWGTLADLRALVDAAHARGMYVFIDVVVNHMADLIDSADAGFPAYRFSPEYTPRWKPEVGTVRHVAPFDTFGKFYMHGTIGNWENQTEAELGDYPGLDSLRTEDPTVRQDLITIYKALVAATDCDGFRADTARHVDLGFWDTFLPAIYSAASAMGKTNFYVFAEATKGSETELGPYTQSNRFNSAINFPFNGTIDAVFVDQSDTGRLTHHTLPAQLTNYSTRAQYQLVNFLDNHDRARYAARLSNDTARAKVALTYLYTTIQVPALYYGTEQGFNGANDPYNREDMFDGDFEYGPSLGDNFDPTHELYRHIRALNLVRAALPALRRGGYAERWNTWYNSGPGGAGLYVFSRTNGAEEVVIAVNTTNAVKSTSNIPVGYAAGTQLINLLDTTDTITVAAGQQISVALAAHTSKIYYPASSAPALPATVTAVAPAHTATGVFPTNSISLTFDKAMNKPATQAAFALSPAVPGNFAWFDGDTRVVFTPSQPLGANTRYTVTLGATAQAANGQQLGAAFVTCFDTTGYATMSVAGTFNGWNPAANNMTLVGPHLWQWDATLNNASGVEFKFTANGTWAINWGGTGLTSTGVYFGSNIVVAGTLNGTYRFQFDDQTFAYSLAVYAPPTVLGVSPGHGAYNVSTGATVTILFNTAMNRASTETAFSLAPFVAGTFAWLDGDTRLVFAPSAPLAMHTHYVVTVGTGATGTNGQQMNAPFSSAFDTGSTYATMSVVGSLNGWNAAANNMTRVGQNLWQWDTNFVGASGIQFKFAANGNWGGTGNGVDWGDNNPAGTTVPLSGIGENFGANIVVSSTLNGRYRFQFNDQTAAYTLQVSPDGDGDGLPDSWEATYGVTSASSDNDGDGLSNLQEFNAGTNPVDAGSAPRIILVARSGAAMVITFTSVAGKQYVVEAASSVVAPSWTVVWGPVAGTGSTVQVMDSSGTTQAQRVYRVRVVP
jgi:glycosidase